MKERLLVHQNMLLSISFATHMHVMMGILKQQPVIRRIFLLTSVGLLLPATNRILMATFREIFAVIPVQLTVSIVVTMLRCCPFEPVDVVSRLLCGYISAMAHQYVTLRAVISIASSARSQINKKHT